MDAKAHRQFRRMKLYLVASTATLAALWLAAFRRAEQDQTRLDEIQARRITITEDDGTPRFLLTSRDASPAQVIEGRTIRGPGQRPGFIFYNDEGQEQGGLTVAGQRQDVSGRTYSAVGHLSFDQWRQDQTVVLRYLDENGQRRAGLTVQDRPEVPMAEMIDEYQAIQQQPDGPAKQAALAEFERRYQGPRRVFVGTTPERAAEVVLSDAQDRPRIVLRVDTAGNPRIELLDAEGRVSRSLTG